MIKNKIGWSQFALDSSVKKEGNSYTILSQQDVIDLCIQNWDTIEPGDGESGVTRKVLVTVPPEGFFLPPRIDLQEGLPVHTEVVKRQAGEDLYLQNFVLPEDAEKFGYKEKPASRVKIVLYSAEALLENDGKRSTDCDWEIVCILCFDSEDEPMAPLTMARNFLEKAGGTKSVYSAQQFAESIYFYSTKGVIIRPSKGKKVL